MSTYVRTSLQPDESTAMTVKVFDTFVSITLGEVGHDVTVMVSDEDTANRLVQAMGEARAKLVGAITRAKRDKATQPELPELAAS